MSGLFFTSDLIFSSRVTGAAKAGNQTIGVVGTVEALLAEAGSTNVRLILLDLSAPGCDVETLIPQIRQAAPEAKVIAYASHVLETKLAAAREAGCDQVMSRGQFNSQMSQILLGCAET